jgi:hypothetical protein
MPVSVSRPRLAAAFSWSIWAAMLLGALWFVARYSSNVPSWDDWDMVPTLTRNQPITLDWLWSEHNEHRVPVPRLLYLALNWLTVVDFRTTMYFDVIAMAAVAMAMMLVARRLRGRISLSDAFFPIIALQLGQAANLLWGWQLQFFLSVILAGVALLAIVQSGVTFTPRASGIVVGCCACLLPLCGANGLGMAPALALWPLAIAWTPPAQGGERGRGGLLVALSVAALALTALYFVGWEPVPYHPKSYSVYQSLKTSLQFLTIGIGPAIRGWWPAIGIATLLVFGATVIRLALVWRDAPEQRGRTLGLLLFLGALASLALGLGLGRNGFETRYVTLAVPAWCCVYFTWTLYPARNLRWLPATLTCAAVLALWPNTRFGLAYAEELRGWLGGFEKDLAAGVPAHQLIHRYGPWLHPHQDIVADYLQLLRDAKVGRYRDLKEADDFGVLPVPLQPMEAEQLEWRDSTARVEGPKPALLFQLPGDRYVEGIRLRYQYASDDGTLPYIGIRWKPSSQSEFVPARYYKYSPTGDRANWKQGAWTRLNDSVTTLTIWIGDTVQQVGITPDFRPATFRIAELSLLVPHQ